MNAEFRTMARTPIRVRSGQAVTRPNKGFFVASQVNSHELIQTIRLQIRNISENSRNSCLNVGFDVCLTARARHA